MFKLSKKGAEKLQELKREFAAHTEIYSVNPRMCTLIFFGTKFTFTCDENDYLICANLQYDAGYAQTNEGIFLRFYATEILIANREGMKGGLRKKKQTVLGKTAPGKLVQGKLL